MSKDFYHKGRYGYTKDTKVTLLMFGQIKEHMISEMH